MNVLYNYEVTLVSVFGSLSDALSLSVSGSLRDSLTDFVMR